MGGALLICAFPIVPLRSANYVHKPNWLYTRERAYRESVMASD